MNFLIKYEIFNLLRPQSQYHKAANHQINGKLGYLRFTKHLNYQLPLLIQSGIYPYSRQG